MKIVVIGLKTADAKRRSATAQLNACGLDFEFFDAITGDGFAEHIGHFDRWRFRLNSRRDPLPGELGCYASHLAVWRACVEMAQPVVVLEDDFQNEPEFGDLAISIPWSGRLAMSAWSRHRADAPC